VGVLSIAAYRPRKGKETQLLDAVADHMKVLRAENLVTNRPAHVMRAEDGTIVEVFEWKSDEAIEQAHSNPQVAKLWERFNEACEYVPLATIPECSELFANFEPLDV
jgi:quinol monooxygenase YgiN